MFGENEIDSNTYSKWCIHIEPVHNYTLLDNSFTVQIDQNSKGFGELGSRIWDGSLVLARYLECRDPSFFHNKKFIELGSGTGIMGIVAALQGADITLTDKKALLPLINHNIEKNSLCKNKGKIRAQVKLSLFFSILISIYL